MLTTTREFTEEELVRLGPDGERERLLACLRFVGRLFLHQMLNGRIVMFIIQELCCKAAAVIPPEHVLEIVCDLMLSTGGALERLPNGSEFMAQLCDRLLNLKQRCGSNERIQTAIQGLLGALAIGWEQRPDCDHCVDG